MLLERGVVEETDDSVGNRSAAEAAGEKERDFVRINTGSMKEREKVAQGSAREERAKCNDHTIVRAHLNTSGEGAARPLAGLSRMLVADTQNS